MRKCACAVAGLLMAALALSAQNSMEIVASKSGFKPQVAKLRKGETVKLLLKSADVDHCFAIDALRIEKRIVPGKTTTLELTPDRVGELPFYCCLEPDNQAQKGKLVVAE